MGHARVDIVHHLLNKILSFLVVRRLSLSLHSDHLQTQFLPVPPYCDENDIDFTRCRPYKKNDQAHIEQKNWTAVRRLIGYDRYESEAAFRLIEAIYADWRLLMNYFQPVRKLIRKERVGAKMRKYYDRAQTPYQRVLAAPEVKEETKRRLQEVYLSLNPVEIRHRMEENLSKLWRCNG